MASGNILYFYLESFNKTNMPAKYWMLFARFIMGFGAGSLLKMIKIK